jgi:phospholipid/cholesterol/gamma-HCH transport system substrate-binding protein
MRRSWAALTVGILALVVLGVTYSIFMYTSEGTGREGYDVHAFFRDALGIYDKSGVRSAGIDIGRIVKKEYDNAKNKARVTINLDKNIVIYENAVVSKRAASLLGEFYLDLDPGTPFSPDKTNPGQKHANRVLGPNEEIKNVFEPTNVGQILDEVSSTLPILKDILRDVKELTSGPVKQIAENANQLIARNSVVLERLLLRVDNIAEHIEDVTRAESGDIKIALSNVRDITEGLKGLVGTSKGEVSQTGAELRSSVQKLQKSIDSLEHALGNVDTITDRLKEGKGTAGQLLTDDTIANNISEITEDAGSFVRGLTRMQTMIGLRTEYNALSRSFKTYFSIQLAPRPDKFYLIEIVDDPRGLREFSRTSTQSSEKGLVEETTYTTSNKLRFSLMFGKRLGFFTGRFGIKESTGGVGVDLHFLEDRLALSADLFDTRSNEYPRLQGRGAIAVYKRNLFLVAGVDDVLNRERSLGSGGAFFDWFFGLQLMFRDEDLKSLLLVGGGAASGAAK